MNNVWQLMIEEWRSVWTNKTIRRIVFLVPVVYMTLFGFLYSESRVMEIPTVIADLDQTELSREMIRSIDHDQTFAVTKVVQTEEEAQLLLDQGEVLTSFIIPQGLTVNAKAGKPTEVLNIIDGSNLLISNTSVRAASSLVKTISGGVTIKKLEAKGEWGDAGQNFATGIDYRYRILHNPTFNYLSFMLLGLAGTVMQQVAFLSVSLSVTRQKETGSWNTSLTANRFFALAISKISIHMLLAMFNFAICFVMMLKVFDIPYYGNLGLFVLVGIVFHLAVISIGFAMSILAGSMLQATQWAMIVAVPSFMLSGWTWPIISMPDWVAALANCLPLTYFLHATREILSKGHGWEYVTHDVKIMLLMTLISLFAGYVAYFWQKNRAVVKKSSTSEIETVNIL
ncbi:ABC transporter permease [Brevibacillus daliensis]|uniref:ABC transporter permease n=1 Tax=Brevibacillus daliensis TaxID=2892995 RepID=UPI001E3D65F6|nr:ABC transporter permease [Brevibacillus daliensis]